MILVVVLLITSLIILLFNIILLYLFPSFTRKLKSKDHLLTISILIAVKNEERNIRSLFSSLELLDYPQDKFEVILVDDESTDNSYRQAVELASGKNNYNVLQVYDKKFPGKKGALNIGVKAAKYPFILITDADCIPARNWLLGYSEKFKDGYDLVFGLAPFIQTAGLINKISCFENLRSSILTFVFAKLKLPYSTAARNLGFKKQSFEKLGGFDNTMDTLSGDDDLLLREAVKQKMKIGMVDLEKSSVLSNSKTSFGKYLNQKARHTKTSHYYLPSHQFLLGLWHSSNILSLASVFFLAVNPLFVLPFVIKMLIDTISVLKIQKKLQYSFKTHEIILLQMLYEIFLIVNFLASFRRNIPWKG